MSKTRLLTILVIALVGMNIFFIARSLMHPPPGHGPIGGHRGKDAGHMDRKLGFDESQIKKHTDFREMHHKASRVLQKELNAELKKLYGLIQADSFPVAEKDSLMTIIEVKTTEINELNLNHFLNIKSILKPEQTDGFNGMIGRLSGDFEKPKKHR